MAFLPNFLLLCCIVRNILKIMEPTKEQFYAFQGLFDYFNKNLFDGQLPDVILNFSRKNQTAGFFAPARWQRITGEDKHEISINPFSLSQGKEYVIQTLVHEMCHLWQQEFGEPSRSGYHNKEWATKMEACGLVPSSTGKVGGKKTGQHMADYLAPDGKLEKLIQAMPDSIWLPFKAIETMDVEDLKEMLKEAEESGNDQEVKEIQELLEEVESKKKKNKTKYSCPGCSVNIWGKPDLNVRCGYCDEEFQPVN